MMAIMEKGNSVVLELHVDMMFRFYCLATAQDLKLIASKMAFLSLVIIQ